MTSKYTVSPDGKSVTDNEAGTTFDYPFIRNGVFHWADAQAFESRYARVLESPDVLRFKVQAGQITECRLAKPNEDASKAGEAVSELLISGDIKSTDGGHLAITWELCEYVVDSEAIKKRAMRLPDGRVVALWTSPGTGRTVAAGILRDGGDAGPAVLLAGTPPAALATVRPATGQTTSVGSSALLVPAPDAMPLSIEHASALALSTDEAEQLAAKAPIANLSIVFNQFCTVEDNGSTTYHKLIGVPILRFRVPTWFGTPPTGDDERPRERWAIYVLVTAPGAVVVNRDKKVRPANIGEIVWLDEKFDLRTIVRFLPRLDPGTGRPVKAFVVKVDPKGKAKFDRKTKRGIEPGFAWRIELRPLAQYTIEANPDKLRIIHGLAANAPEIPYRPGDNDVTAQAGAEDMDQDY